MRPFFRRGAVLLAISALAAGVWWALQDPEPPGLPGPDGEPEIKVENLRSFVVHKNGVRLWEFSARQVTVNDAENATIATGVDRAILYRNGKPYLTLRAQRVRLDNQSNDLKADGEVRASGADGFVLETDRADWGQATQRLECPLPVQARVRRLFFRAPRLTYDAKLGRILCAEAVMMRSAGASLKGSRLVADVKRGIVTMGGGAELVFEPRVLKPRELLSR